MQPKPKFRYKKPSKQSILAYLLETNLTSPILEDSLDALRRLMAKRSKVVQDETGPINQAESETDGNYEDELADAFIGCAFVLCQAYITSVIGTAKLALNKLGRNDMSERKQFIDVGGNPTVQRVCDAANYFKHHDEWTVIFDKAKNQHAWVAKKDDNVSLETINAAVSWGLQPSDKANMDKVLAAFGIMERAKLTDLAAPLKKWHSEIIKLVLASRNPKPVPSGNA